MEQESQKRKLDETGYETSNASILCANNCGFFGNSTTNNLCSKCYKEFLSKHSKDLVGDSASALVEKALVAVDDGQNATIKEPKHGGRAEVEGTSSGNPEKRPANRCSFCKKRVGLTGFKCKCDQTFCSIHRYSDKHNCVFDYKGAAQDAIAKANPVVKAHKIEKI